MKIVYFRLALCSTRLSMYNKIVGIWLQILILANWPSRTVFPAPL